MELNDQFLQLNTWPNTDLILKEPPIYRIKEFLSQEECSSLVEKARGEVQRSRVLDMNTLEYVTHHARTSESCNFGYEIDWLISKVSSLTNLPSSHQEPAQFTRYTKGQFYRAHQDSLYDPDPVTGQRVATVLIYLNTVQRGGATFFNSLNLRVKPEAGSAVIFFPSKLNGERDLRYLHAAEEAVDEKWVAQIWVRNKPYNLLAPDPS